MEYNTQKDHLVIREYGRNVQNLINYAVTIKDPRERQAFVDMIIRLMGDMNPNLKNVEEYKIKLWDHLFLISNFKLDVESPYPKPTKAEDVIPAKPDRVEYPKNKISFRHYGKNVEVMIEKAKQMEDKEMQREYSEVIANYMKLVYATWNRDGVNDEQIKSDFNMLSGGTLTLDSDVSLNTIKAAPVNRRSNKRSSKGRNYRKGPRNNNGGGGKRYRNKRNG